VISVRFKPGGKAYYFDPRDLTIKKGEYVLVETSRGTEFGEVAEGNQSVDDRFVVAPLRPVIRIMTNDDFKIVEANRQKQKRAWEVCQRKINEHKLDMRIMEVEYTFDGSKIVFYFTADGRVDFRELVRDLAGIFKTRIELRQVGVRDEAKMLGGLGICGRPFCCASFLDDFAPVSIKMAKEQGLSLNPTKISGTCGRLMCCLKYEQEAYEDLLKNTPRLESTVQTPQGPGTVVDVNLLRGKLKVLSENGDAAPKDFTVEEISLLRPPKTKREKAEAAELEAAEGNAIIEQEEKPHRTFERRERKFDGERSENGQRPPRPERKFDGERSENGQRQRFDRKPRPEKQEKPEKQENPNAVSQTNENSGENHPNKEHNHQHRGHRGGRSRFHHKNNESGDQKPQNQNGEQKQ